MRKSILLFKRLKSIDSDRFRFLSLSLACVLGIVAIASCMHSGSNPSQAPDDSWSILNLINGAKLPDQVDLIVKRDGMDHLIAKVRPLDCKDNTAQHWQLTLQSEFGEHIIDVEFDPSTEDKGVAANIGDTKVLIENGLTLSPDKLGFICDQATSGKHQVVLNDPSVEQQTLAWLGKVTPDCSLSVEKGGTWCNVRKVDPRSAEDELRSIRVTMIRRWSRQPYILSRRLSISINLAVALQSPDKNQALDTICRVISVSDPIEVPLALSTETFDQAVCKQVKGNRIDSAMVSLTKSLEEIELLRQLFERTSKLGILSIKVPKELAPTKDLWISLTPDESVAELLVEEAEKLSKHDKANNSNEDIASGVVKSCWHPLFSGQQEGQLAIANHLDLAGKSSGIDCATMSTIGEKRSYRYLADSITSETEFVITNGRSKLLRLPNGSYSYKITGHTQTMGWEAVPDKSTGGQVSWQGRRPSASIKTW